MTEINLPPAIGVLILLNNLKRLIDIIRSTSHVKLNLIRFLIRRIWCKRIEIKSRSSNGQTLFEFKKVIDLLIVFHIPRNGVCENWAFFKFSVLSRPNETQFWWITLNSDVFWKKKKGHSNFNLIFLIIIIVFVVL